MLRKVLAIALMLALLAAAPALAKGGDAPAQSDVYQALIAMMDQYPEGSAWSSGKSYSWAGGIYTTGYGCVSFSFMMSDAAFGDLPARQLRKVDYAALHVGDILRTNHNTHTVVVLEVRSDEVVVAEGCYNNAVHWGRTLDKDEVLKADWVLTRYPEGEIIL